MDLVFDYALGALLGLLLVVGIYLLVEGIQARKTRAEYREMEARAHQQEREAYWGINARIDTLTAEQIKQAEQDRQEYFSLTGHNRENPYPGTATYNNAQEQAILERARYFAKTEGVSLKEGLQLAYRHSYCGSTVPSMAAGTVTAEQLRGAAGQRQQSMPYGGSTCDPREVQR